MTDRLVEDQSWMAGHLLLPHTLGRSFYVKPEIRKQTNDRQYFSNINFWRDILDPQKATVERTVTLTRFNIFEWIPRNPGLYHTEAGAQAREEAQANILSISHADYTKFEREADAPPDHANAFRAVTSGDQAARTVIYTPQGKYSMLQGGIGCVRLRPVEWKTGQIFWFMSASSTAAPDEGIPLLVPDVLYQRIIDEIRRVGAMCCDIIGRTKFIPKEFSDLYSTLYRIQRVYIDVAEITAIAKNVESSVVSVATSFLSEYEGLPRIYASYVTFDPGYRGARENAAEWMHEEYIGGLYKGSVLTDFDQQETEIPGTLFGLDQVLTSPDLADKIATLKEKFGRFDWDMLARATFSFHTHQEQIMVGSVIKGKNNRVNITTGQESPIKVTESAGAPGVQSTPQEKYRHIYTLLAWGTGTAFLVALLVISLIWPTPTPPQLRVQVSLLALAAAGFATVISGLLNITANLGAQMAIGASGALAVFVLFYLQNPAVLQ